MHDIEYEWVKGIQYQDRIYQFLKEINAIMIPTLSDRVCISDYSKKLASLAENLFIGQNGCDIASCSVYCNSEVAFISSIAVKKEFLNRGIGTFLINETKQYTRRKKCKSIQLEVYCQNSRALKFYKKNSFVIIAEKSGLIKMEYLFETREHDREHSVIEANK